MEEKREFDRFPVQIPCILLKDTREYPCIVHDISERGISFDFNDGKSVPDMPADTEISFWFIDNYKIYGKEESSVIICNGKIRNSRKINGHLIYGSYVIDEQFENYVHHRKFAEYLKEKIG